MLHTIAIIPARGGSKRLPRKNVLDLGGRPMLAHTINTAKNSGLFDEVFVSTEDEQISKIASTFGATVVKRPHELASDRSTVVEVCMHALGQLPDAKVFCCIYATAVLLEPDTLRRSFDMLDEPSKANFVMGVSNFEFPAVQALASNSHGFLSYMWPEWINIQSQFYPDLVVSNGSFYWARRDAFLKERTFYGENLRGYLVPRDQVKDINDGADFEMLKLNFEQRCS